MKSTAAKSVVREAGAMRPPQVVVHQPVAAIVLASAGRGMSDA
jgi:hypothetical protein